MSVDRQINPPDLTDTLRNLKQDIFNTLNCINIGKIEAFNPTEQTATIRLMIDKIKDIQEDGTRVIQKRPLLVRCPVVVLFGGSGFLTFNIQPGDECIVLFNDRQIDTWLITGEENPPQTSRAHSISDGLALVGINSLKNVITDYLTTGVRLSSGTSRIDLTPNQIDSIASLFVQTGNFQVDGNTTLNGITALNGNVTNTSGITSSGTITGGTISAGNGATGTFTTVNVQNGIVVSGS